MASIPCSIVFKKPMYPPPADAPLIEMSSLMFSQMHKYNESVPFMSANGTFVSIMRVRDGSVQHIRKNSPVKINLVDGVSVEVCGATVKFNKLPGRSVEAFCQITPFKFESLQKPTIIPEICFNFHRPAITAGTLSLGLGDFMVVFKHGGVPDIIIFITDASMQALWPAETISKVFCDLVRTFKRGGSELHVDMKSYARYMVDHIDPDFMWWEVVDAL